VNELLTRERLLGAGGKVTTYSTPRRLAVLVEGCARQPGRYEEKLTGPSWKVAFKDGAPTAAAQAFAKKAGVAVEALEKVTNAKGEYVGATVKRPGRAAAELLAAELPKEVLGSTGPRTCTGARASRSGLCGRCAGLWRCSIPPLFRWRLPGLRRAMLAAGIACCTASAGG
jgi:glycyl-tRNA synthetase beta subunit